MNVRLLFEVDLSLRLHFRPPLKVFIDYDIECNASVLGGHALFK